jgi:hypothetical protein
LVLSGCDTPGAMHEERQRLLVLVPTQYVPHRSGLRRWQVRPRAQGFLR